MSFGSYSSSAYNNQLIEWIQAGYHITLCVNNGGHWIAIDEAKSLSTGQVYIMDSSSYSANADITLTSRYSTFAVVHAYRGGSTPSGTCTVTFDANGGTCSTSSQRVQIGGSLSSLPTATRNGYTLRGWYTGPIAGRQVTTSTVFTSDKTVYAHWSCTHASYSPTVITAATCAEPGLCQYTCSGCNDSYTEEIPPTGNHSFSNHVCTVCGYEDPLYSDYSGDYYIAAIRDDDNSTYFWLTGNLLSPEVSYSAESFCYQKLNGANTANDIHAMCTAIMCYVDAATDYFG